MSSGKKWDTVARYTPTRTPPLGAPKKKINHTLQKDDSPGALALSKQEKMGKFAEAMQKSLAECGDKTRTNLAKKEKCWFSVVIVKLVQRLESAEGNFAHIQAEPGGALEGSKACFPPF